MTPEETERYARRLEVVVDRGFRHRPRMRNATTSARRFRRLLQETCSQLRALRATELPSHARNFWA